MLKGVFFLFICMCVQGGRVRGCILTADSCGVFHRLLDAKNRFCFYAIRRYTYIYSQVHLYKRNSTKLIHLLLILVGLDRYTSWFWLIIYLRFCGEILRLLFCCE